MSFARPTQSRQVVGVMSGRGGWQRHGRFSDTFASVSCGKPGVASDKATNRQAIIGNNSMLSHQIQVFRERADRTKEVVARMKPESVKAKFRENNNRVKLLSSK
jgi:hypothetical protein